MKNKKFLIKNDAAQNAGRQCLFLLIVYGGQITQTHLTDWQQSRHSHSAGVYKQVFKICLWQILRQLSTR